MRYFFLIIILALCFCGCSKRHRCYGEGTTFFFLYNNDTIRTSLGNITQAQSEELIKMYEQNGHTFIEKKVLNGYIEIDFSPNAYEKKGYKCIKIRNF